MDGWMGSGCEKGAAGGGVSFPFFASSFIFFCRTFEIQEGVLQNDAK
jgi:hypothetical protein